MKAKNVKITQVGVNESNPRAITKEKFEKLINSLLIFPKMMELRPVVINDTMEALGGNMRLKALKAIAEKGEQWLIHRLSSLQDYQILYDGEKEALLSWWRKWLSDPIVPVVSASGLSEREREQFIIKDNVSYGQWDYDRLANQWDSRLLDDWGLDVWNIDPSTFSAQTTGDTAADSTTISESNGDFNSALPPELQGVNLVPDDLPKINGDDLTATERVIITYTKKQESEMAQLLGLSRIDKVVYRIEELIEGSK